jgi:hypothetical protein
MVLKCIEEWIMRWAGRRTVYSDGDEVCDDPWCCRRRQLCAARPVRLSDLDIEEP